LSVRRDENDGFVSDLNKLADIIFTPIILISFGTFVVVLASYTNVEFGSQAQNTKVDLDALRREREELRSRILDESRQTHQGPADILVPFASILINLRNIIQSTKDRPEVPFELQFVRWSLGEPRF